MNMLFNQISYLNWISLIGGGFLFGIVFTITHFWALKKYVFTKKNFKSTLFLLSLIRLVIFGIVLWLIIHIHHNVLEVLIFFIMFTVARWITFARTKRILDNGKEL